MMPLKWRGVVIVAGMTCNECGHLDREARTHHIPKLCPNCDLIARLRGRVNELERWRKNERTALNRQRARADELLKILSNYPDGLHLNADDRKAIAEEETK